MNEEMVYCQIYSPTLSSYSPILPPNSVLFLLPLGSQVGGDR